MKIALKKIYLFVQIQIWHCTFYNGVCAQMPVRFRAMDIIIIINQLDPTAAVAGRSVQSWNDRRIQEPLLKKSWRLTTERNATNLCHTLADTFCNNISSLRACVALLEILIFIGFVHAISKMFTSIFVMIKYGVT